MTKPLYFYNGTTFELVGPTTPQSPIAYQTSAPTGPATGDLWVDSDGDVDTYNRQLTRYYFVATAAQTTISGVDANSLTLAYVAGSEAVYVNGALQVRGQDYTATNGTSVVMSSALAVNDVVEIFAYTAFTVANAYTKTETDSIAAAAAGLRMVVPTSVAVGSGSGSVDTNGAITFSGASTVSINGCFNSTYDNYIIYVNLTSISADNVDFSIRYRASGTDTSANYLGQRLYVYSTSVGADLNAVGTDEMFLGPGDKDYADYSAMTIESIAPNKANKTKTFIKCLGYYATVYYAQTNSAVQTDNTQFDGFTFICSTGNATGTIRVYGLKN
jgi:hypothetical protein